MERRDKENYYLDIAQAVAGRGTCLRRNFGAIIVKHDQIMSTGYSGAPRGRRNCCDLGYCLREKMNIPRGSGMSFAGRFTRRPTPSSTPPAAR